MYTNESLEEYINDGHKGNPILLRFTSNKIHSLGDDIWGSDLEFESLSRQLRRIFSKNSRIWSIPIPSKELGRLQEHYRKSGSTEIPTHYLYLQLDQWYIRPDKTNILFMTRLMNYPGIDHHYSGDGQARHFIYYCMVPENSQEYTNNINRLINR